MTTDAGGRVSRPVKFPVARYADARQLTSSEYAKELARASETIDPAAMEQRGGDPDRGLHAGARMFSCGNGGSASIANHMQCDHVKGIRNGNRPRPAAC